MAASGRLVLALVVFAAAYAAASAYVGMVGGWFGSGDPRVGPTTRELLTVILPLFTAIATLSNLAAWTSRSAVIASQPFARLAAVQALAAILSIAVEIGLTGAFGVLPRQLDLAAVAVAVCWLFLGPALLHTRGLSSAGWAGTRHLSSTK